MALLPRGRVGRPTDSQSRGRLGPAIARSEDGKAIALRVFNPTASAVNGTITLAGGVAAARLATLEEVPGETLAVSDGRVALSVGPKKIVTVLVEMT